MLAITLLLALLIFGSVLLVLLWARAPRYRLRSDGVIALLRLVQEGAATEHDWRLFSALPLRHDPHLEAIRERCLEIEDREYIGRSKDGFLFSPKGLDELRIVLEELEKEAVG